MRTYWYTSLRALHMVLAVVVPDMLHRFRYICMQYFKMHLTVLTYQRWYLLRTLSRKGRALRLPNHHASEAGRWKRAIPIAVHTVAVVDEREKERDRYTPWLHREVQGRVAGPLVQLRFISLIPCSGANQR